MSRSRAKGGPASDASRVAPDAGAPPQRRVSSGVRRIARYSEDLDALDLYLQDIGGQQLDHAQEIALSRRIDAATRDAFAALVDMGVALPELAELVQLASDDEAAQQILHGEELDAQRDALSRAARTERRHVALLNTIRTGRVTSERRTALLNEREHLLGLRAKMLDAVALCRAQMDDIASRVEQSLDLLEADVGRLSPRWQQKPSFLEARERARAARHELTRANLRLVVSFAKRYGRLGVPLSDLIQEGNIGLMRAVDRYDHRRGTRFSTLAAWWIKQAILQAVSEQRGTIRVPRHVGIMRAPLQRARTRLEQVLSREPTQEELAVEARLSLDVVRQLDLAQQGTMSLDGRLDGAGGWIGGDAALSGVASAQTVVMYEDRLLAHELLDKLCERERRVMRLRLGFEGHRPHTLRETGEALGLTAERVRQLEAQALATLREILEHE